MLVALLQIVEGTLSTVFGLFYGNSKEAQDKEDPFARRPDQSLLAYVWIQGKDLFAFAAGIAFIVGNFIGSTTMCVLSLIVFVYYWVHMFLFLGSGGRYDLDNEFMDARPLWEKKRDERIIDLLKNQKLTEQQVIAQTGADPVRVREYAKRFNNTVVLRSAPKPDSPVVWKKTEKIALTVYAVTYIAILTAACVTIAQLTVSTPQWVASLATLGLVYATGSPFLAIIIFIMLRNAHKKEQKTLSQIDNTNRN